MTKIPLGKVAFTDAGSYNAGKTYKRFDFVDTEDSSYLSLQDNNKGHAVTETAWWKCLARGTKATEAAKKANDAAALANEKAVAADTAAGRLAWMYSHAACVYIARSVLVGQFLLFSLCSKRF